MPGHPLICGAVAKVLKSTIPSFQAGDLVWGQTIFISAASGGVGQIVGQLAKLEGLNVIKSVRSDAELDFIVDELGFDAGFNYKTEKVGDALQRLAPGGIDIYYGNVGDETLDAALVAMKNFGRISTYYPTPSSPRQDRVLTLFHSWMWNDIAIQSPAGGKVRPEEHDESLPQATYASGFHHI